MKRYNLPPVLFIVLCLLGNYVFAAETLVIYSGRSDKFIKPVLEEFTRQSGIEIIIHAGKSTALLHKLELEGDRSGADLFISNDAGTLQKGSDMKLFAALADDLLAPVAKNLRAADNTWLGLSARARVLVVNNTSTAKSFVKSVFDLADPRLAGRLGITNSSNESYIAGVTVYMLATDVDKTESWLNGLKENANGQVFNKHSQIVKSVANGKLDVGLVNHYYIYRYLAEHPEAPISLVMPDQGPKDMGVAWNVAGIAISKYSAHKPAAEKLIAFLISPAGQRQFADVNLEYPTRRDVAANEKIPPISSFRIANVPMSELGKQRNATLDLIEKVGMP